MDLQEFLTQTQARLEAEVADRIQDAAVPYPSNELVFADIVMEHMADVGMTEDPKICQFSGKIGSANLKLAGYAISEDLDSLDLFVSLYRGAKTLEPVSDTDTKHAAQQCVQFLSRCVDGKLGSTLDVTHDAFELVTVIQASYESLDRVRIFVLTDGQARSKSFKPREVQGKTVGLEVMDIERLHRHWAEGKPRDELVVNFEEVSGSALPCVYVPGQMEGYDYALAAIPAETLFVLYEKFGPRLLEANVRSFLSATGKVNRGMRDTLKDFPEKFMAYNNGIVLVADEGRVTRTADGSAALSWLRGMQIVNGGQTTASIYFTRKKSPETDLSRVRVPAKIIILQAVDAAEEEQMISDISRYANSQNSVKQSDLSANKPFHIQLEKLASTTFCPDGIGRWFYERAAGSYNVLLAREGTTPAKLKKLKDAIPPFRKLSKTDVAKYYLAWDRRPFDVSYGDQKNFIRFMDYLADGTVVVPDPLDVAWYKTLIAKSILFRAVHRISRAKHFEQAKANIATYLVSLVSERFGDRFKLARLWERQGISSQLQAQLEVWAKEVESGLRKFSGGKMISEQAKREECWDVLKELELSAPHADIPELT